VCHAVVVQVGAGREPLAAHLALVWLLSAVDAPVCVEGTGRGEPFAAHQTHVRLLTCTQHVAWYITVTHSPFISQGHTDNLFLVCGPHDAHFINKTKICICSY
jgi:hypothetical protein